MLFDTFIFRFELRSGCLIMACLHLGITVAALYNVFHQTNIYFIMVLCERIFEICLGCFLYYAAYKTSRPLLKLWMLCIPPVFLFNLFYSSYESLVKYHLISGILLLISLYIITISLMVTHSFYNELGLIEHYLKDLAELRDLRSAEQKKDSDGSMESDMEMNDLYSMERKVRTDEMPLTLRGQQEYFENAKIDDSDTISYRKIIITGPSPSTSNQQTESSRNSHEQQKGRTALTNFLRQSENSQIEIYEESSLTVSVQVPETDGNETETTVPRIYPRRSTRHSGKPPKPKGDSG